MRPLFVIVLCIFITLVIPGCISDSSDSTISDGELVGIGDWDVHGTIDCEPNSGRQGTPVTITIILDRGESQVEEIRAWQAYEMSSWEFVRTPDVDPKKESGDRWSVWHNLFLTGESGIVRFYAINNDIRIAWGDVDINGGRYAAK